MAQNVLISLVSEQTIPNLELIKEFKNLINKHLIVHTPQTNKQKEWIINAARLLPDTYETIEIDAFDIKAIEKKLNEYSFADDNYYLNITGGTKVMILVFQEFFKNLGAKIFYVTGKDCEYLKVFPVIGERKFSLVSRITLDEYLTAYGFEIKKSTPMHDFSQTKSILEFFLNNSMKNNVSELEKVRIKRGKVLNYNDDEELKTFIGSIGFEPKDIGKLDKYETKYLSGDWFEEYIYYKLKEELKLSEENIGTGYNVTKEHTTNELDVLVVHENRLYIIECKTSVIESRQQPDGTIKEIKFLPEVIYKSDALRSKFGLFANTSIITLEEIKNDDGTPMKGYETHFDRAELSRINIISKQDLKSGKQLVDLLKIK